MQIKKLKMPLSVSVKKSLRCGEIISLSGTIYTARDAAHKRIASIIDCNGDLPLDLKDMAIYYCGPTPTRPGEIIGSCGPTTSSRMDDYTPLLLSYGVSVMIGKGKRSDNVNKAIGQHNAVYFAAIGGAGALYQSKIKSCECIAFEDLGCEAIYKLEVEDLQLVVATDASGNSLF